MLILFLQKVEVQAPVGQTCGFVRQAWSVCKPKYKIQNANDETVLIIDGPCCTCNICGDVEFQVGQNSLINQLINQIQN